MRVAWLPYPRCAVPSLFVFWGILALNVKCCNKRFNCTVPRFKTVRKRPSHGLFFEEKRYVNAVNCLNQQAVRTLTVSAILPLLNFSAADLYGTAAFRGLNISSGIKARGPKDQLSSAASRR